MDYKYIEQLLQRYWECQATLEEEAILRAFFSQKDIPAELLPYADLFRAEEQMEAEARLGKDFDEKVLKALGEEHTVRAERMKWSQRLRPFYKAADHIAKFNTIGDAINPGSNKPGSEMATELQEPGDSTSVELVDEATAETEPGVDSTYTKTDTY